jgi:futalosine hydrolase
MRLLIVSATENEISYIRQKLNKQFDILITGVGAPATFFSLENYLEQKKFDYIINVGIAGSFNNSLKIGSVFQVSEDTFADVGFEDIDRIIPIQSTNFNSEFYNTHINESKIQELCMLGKVKSITVNSSSGSTNTIENRVKLFNADIETMEGAAFFKIANKYCDNYLQIRAISNYIEPRNTEKWDINLAINNLTSEVLNLIKLIEKSNSTK